MITLLTGENSFEVHQAIQSMVRAFDGVAEKIDGSELELRQLPDLLMGGTLFASKRLVIIKQLSENSAVWPELGAWLPRIGDDIHVVFVEPKPDKRTKTYKDLQKVATVADYKAWSERDIAKAEQWLAGEAKVLSCELDRSAIQLVVRRVGPDQWALHHALQKLAVLDAVTLDDISNLIDAHPVENVFEVFDAALRGNTRKLTAMLATLQLTEDPYRLFGLLSGQAFQLATLAAADKPTPDVAKDFGVHPYGLGKLSPYARQMGRSGARRVITAFAEADAGMKTSAGDPWLLIERALVKVAAGNV